MIQVTHNAGFFSCCSVRLHRIVEFINVHKRLPDSVDSSQQFQWYKNGLERDITFDYFERQVPSTVMHPIHYHHSHQFKPYEELDFAGVIPLIQMYFSPSVEIRAHVRAMEMKYHLQYEHICVLFYRGNDKNRETTKCGYYEYLVHANRLLQKDPALVFLVQSDETEFIEFMTAKFPTNSFCFKDEIRHMKKCNDTVDHTMNSRNYEFSKKYLAITILMSKCKHVICGSGNCDMWIMFYRGGATNVIQNLNGRWSFFASVPPRLCSRLF